jgi:hypothetical protein
MNRHPIAQMEFDKHDEMFFILPVALFFYEKYQKRICIGVAFLHFSLLLTINTKT